VGFSVSKNPFTWISQQRETNCATSSRYLFQRNCKKYCNCPMLVYSVLLTSCV